MNLEVNLQVMDLQVADVDKTHFRKLHYIYNISTTGANTAPLNYKCHHSYIDRKFIYLFIFILVLPKYSFANNVINSLGVWENEITLKDNNNFVVQWTPDENRIIFRVTARTRGYIGIGFNSKPKMNEADIVVGWVHSGKIYLQDRHGVGNEAPSVDHHQDWDLIGGLENDTHTVLTMARPYVTCDPFDYSFQNNTVYLLWAYHPDDPVDPESPKPRLHYHGWRKGSVPQILLQRASPTISNRVLKINQPKETNSRVNFRQVVGESHSTVVFQWPLLGRATDISNNKLVSSVHWCRLFRRPSLVEKHHVIQFEPVIMREVAKRVHHMMLYECVRRSPDEEKIFAHIATTSGGVCGGRDMRPLIVACNHVVVTWALGSQGVWLPEEAGYPISPTGPVFYMLETHYNVTEMGQLNDSSGMVLHYTPDLRNFDAGVLSVGLHPNWKHIIPPGQPSVVSEGHCVPECTHATFPSTGINIFGVMFHTHLLGRRVRLRHIRGNTELAPIASDNNYDFSYQEYRSLRSPRNVLPGDHMITECIYSSEESVSITLGGFKTKEEMCLSFVFYYPKIDLSFCHSKPSLGTVLLSLGIQELSNQSQPITIRLPAVLAGKTLKWRLQNYDWENHFEHFQRATHRGTFNVMCRGLNVVSISNSEYHYPNITTKYLPPDVCIGRRQRPKAYTPRAGSGVGLESEIAVDTEIEDEAGHKLIERLDVDPASDFDLFMPVIGVEESPKTTAGLSTSRPASTERVPDETALEEEFQREMGIVPLDHPESGEAVPPWHKLPDQTDSSPALASGSLFMTTCNILTLLVVYRVPCWCLWLC